MSQKINDFTLRDYQIPIWDAIVNKGYRKVFAVLPRRAGKDMCAFNLCIHQAMAKTCSILYALPSFTQGRSVIWDAITSDGKKLLDYIPKEAIRSLNHSQMKISFKNDSQIQIIGSDSYNTSIVGRNPYAIVFSEWSRCDPLAYDYARPILANNGGFCLMITTPYGSNWCKTHYNNCLQYDDWFCYLRKTSEIKHISEDVLALERQQISTELYEQEYECSWNRGVQGSVYGELVHKIRENGQIGLVPWDPSLLTHTAWDIGVNDATAIIWWQQANNNTAIKIIDFYMSNNMGLEQYIRIVKEKPYIYGFHYAPHDIAVREFGGGAISRFEKAAQLGLNFEVLPQFPLMDGIENVLTFFPRFVIDSHKCKRLVEAMEFYHKQWVEEHQCYTKIVHDWSSNACFAGDTLILTRNGMRQIMSVADNDEVLTLQGWAKCLRAQKTRTNAELVEIVFEDGTKVKCTPDHLFLTESGWKSAETLTNGTKIQSNLMLVLNILMDIFTDYIQMKNTSQEGDHYSTEMFGNLLLEKYQEIVRYITEIFVPIITACITLNVYQKKIITEHIIQLLEEHLVKNVEIKQQNGMLQKQVDCGIVVMQNEAQIGQSGNVNQEIVCIVTKSLVASLEKMGIHKNIVIPTVKLRTIANVNRLKQREDVWDINVPNVGHFSLSNTAIVHNCDALRYMCMAIPRSTTTLTPESFERIKREALYSKDYVLPPVFQAHKNYY